MKLSGLLILCLSMPLPWFCSAEIIHFTSAVASWEQLVGGDFLAADTIDGITVGSDGWAIGRASTSSTTYGFESPQYIEWTLGNTHNPADYTFVFYYNYGDYHVMEEFSLSYMTSTSPDWIPIESFTSLTSNNVSTVISNSSGSLFFDGTAATEQQTITVSLPAITGLRLDTLEMPGRNSNGNFVMTEIQGTFSSVPEPSHFALLLSFGSLFLTALRKRIR